MNRHHFTVMNAGPNPADALRFDAVAEPGATVVDQALVNVPILMAGGRLEISLDIPASSYEGGLRLRAQWIDASGDREKYLADIKRHG